MTTTYANILPVQEVDGLAYASATPVTSTEADLFNQSQPNPGLPFQQAVFAVVQLTASGNPASQTTYVVMQTDLGDGVWIDLAWCVATHTSGTQTFALSAGAFVGNALQQSRALGTAPASSGSNQLPLGGRIRFTGKTAIGGSSSSSLSSGQTGPQVTATIKYRALGLR